MACIRFNVLLGIPPVWMALVGFALYIDRLDLIISSFGVHNRLHLFDLCSSIPLFQ